MTDADRPAFVGALARLAVALREPEPDVAMMRTYFDALGDLEVEFVLAAADRLMRGTTWFPKVSEWRQMAKHIECEHIDAQQAMLRKRATPMCAGCGDTGWRMLEGNRATRCACVSQRRLELLGRALPPGEAEHERVPGEEG